MSGVLLKILALVVSTLVFLYIFRKINLIDFIKVNKNRKIGAVILAIALNLIFTFVDYFHLPQVYRDVLQGVVWGIFNAVISSVITIDEKT